MVYHTKHSKDMKANYGFKLRNKHDLDYESDRHSTEEVATVCKGDESKINSFTVNRLSGVSLVDYEMSAEELVTFLERVNLSKSGVPCKDQQDHTGLYH